MDVERTMEFILEMHAKSEERIAKSEARMDKFDKRLEATRKLVEAGMKIVLKTDKIVRALAVQVNALTEAQRKSDRKFERFMDSWAKQRSNGHQQRS